jgi:predicted ATPase
MPFIGDIFLRLVEAELVYQRGFSPQATYVFKHALLQEAAYQSLLRSTRQQYHQHIAQVLAAQFPDLVETQPELLAHHYTEAGLADAAVGYWQRAGQKASERAACVEAISHFTTGLEVLRTLPDTPARTQYELDLLLLLGPAVHLARGQASPEYEHVYVQAHALCQRLGDTPHLFAVLTGLRQMYNARGESQTARQYGEQALALALDLQDPALLGTAHYSLGVALLNLGEVTSAHAHFAQGITHADAARDSWWGALSRLFAAKTL